MVTDSHGIWLTEKDTNGVSLPEQLRLINNTIAFTKDNWNTASLAITPNGVYAPALYSTIMVGENLYLVNSSGSFSVDGQGVNITNLSLNMTSADNSKRIIIDPIVGVKLQIKDGTVWKDGFYFNDSGKLSVEELQANKIKIKNSTDTLIDAYSKTIDFSKFTTIAGKLTATNIDASQLTVSSANISGTVVADAVKSNWVYAGAISANQITGNIATLANSVNLGSASDYMQDKYVNFYNYSSYNARVGLQAGGVLKLENKGIYNQDIQIENGNNHIYLSNSFPNGIEIKTTNDNGAIALDSDRLGFYGSYPIVKQTATSLPSTATLNDVIIKVNGIMGKLQNLGLLDVT